VAGDPGVLVEAFDGARGKAQIELFSQQPVGDTIVVPLKLHVVVDVHGRLFPFGELVGLSRQRFEGGPVDLLKAERRVPGNFWKGRPLRSSISPLSRWLSSLKLKKVSLRMRARIQRSTNSTAPSPGPCPEVF